MLTLFSGHLLAAKPHFNLWPYRCKLKSSLYFKPWHLCIFIILNRSGDLQTSRTVSKSPKPSPHSAHSCTGTCYQYFRYLREIPKGKAAVVQSSAKRQTAFIISETEYAGPSVLNMQLSEGLGSHDSGLAAVDDQRKTWNPEDASAFRHLFQSQDN